MPRPQPHPERPTRSPIPTALGRVAAWVAAGLVAQVATPAPAQERPGLRPPGPESFAAEPRTPLELWDAVDYLVRTGQAPLAVPYVNAFRRSDPDDAALLRIRDRYGLRSILRLRDDPATAPLADPIYRMVNEAVLRHAHDPGRIERAVAGLTGSREEQDYGVERLRQAGPYAIPALVRRLSDPALPDDDRALIVANLGRLDASAVPALVAVLDGPDAALAADAAAALGRIGDPRAVPDLAYHAARADAPDALRSAARQARDRLTRRGTPPPPPARLLADQARAYLLGRVPFPAETVELWDWPEGEPAPRPVALGRDEAAIRLGLRRARQALTLDPEDEPARVTATALELEDAVRRESPAAVASQDPTGAFARAVAAGPAVLRPVVRLAIDAGLSDLANVAVRALAQADDRASPAVGDRSRPLVDALNAPDRRVQLAAAEALVRLDPDRPLAGSSALVPLLARFAAMQAEPRAVVIDGNLNRAGLRVDLLRGLGYDPLTAADGREGFRLAADSADVEFVVLDPTALRGPWNWIDTIVNLRADARTAGLPILVVGPIRQNVHLATTLADYPRVATLVETDDPRAFRTQLERELSRMGHRPLSPEERRDYARTAASLLAELASRPDRPLAAGLASAEPSLSLSLHRPEAAPAASTALADIPAVEAQRSLADVLLDPSRPPALRVASGERLARSIRRFGPLLTVAQERRLAEQAATESDPSLRPALSAALDALRPPPPIPAGGPRRPSTPPAPPPPAAGR